MKLKPYPELKDSGSERIGYIPIHWKAKKLKFFAKICNGQDQKDVVDDDGKFPILGTGGEFGRSNHYLYHKPSVLLGRKGTIDNPLYVNTKFWTVDTLFFTKINQNVFPKYFYYSCRTLPFQKYATSTAVPSMTQEVLNAIELVEPPFEEQKVISKFLDIRTEQINDLIEKNKQLIELEKEKRAALINHVVTKGLDSNVKMKDSGIDWIGEIPEHWEIMRIKFLLHTARNSLKTGPFGSQLTSKDMEGNEFKVYNQRNVLDKNQEKGENYVSEKKFKELVGFTTGPGDILVTTRGTIGKCFKLNNKAQIGILHPCLMKLRVNSKLMLDDYIVDLIEETEISKIQFFLQSNATTIEVIYQDNLKELILPIPPIKEQVAIHKHITKINTVTNNKVSKIAYKLQLLQEYKQSLIHHVVTGKVDVREVEI